MGSFIQQVFTLLTTDTGSLTYHLVLAFSIVGALQAAFTFSRTGDSSRGQRMVIGLSLLFVLQLVLFVGAGLVWQGLLDAGSVLPPLDRAVGLLSLIIIIWLWTFPDSNRSVDGAAILVGLLTITVTAMGVVWWSGQETATGFNGSMPDTIAGIYALVLIVIGAVLLIIRRPDGWVAGLSMLGLFSIGYLVDLALPPIQGDYSGAVRLAQMAAFPLLLVLPQRFSAPGPGPVIARRPGALSGDRGDVVDTELISAFIALASETNPNKTYTLIATTVARLMQADLCLLLKPPEESGDMRIVAGYDAVNEQVLQDIRLENRKAPVLASTLRHGQTLRLPANSSSPDLLGLAQTLNLERTGDLLVAPLKTSEETSSLPALILLSPYSQRAWDESDEILLKDISGKLVRLLQHNEKLVNQQKELQQARVTAEHAQSMIERARQEREKLLDQLSNISVTAEKDRSQLESLAAMLAVQGDVHATIASLQAENEELKKAAGQIPGEVSSETKRLEGELRLALQEISMLKASLSEADKKVVKLQDNTLDGAIPAHQVEAIASLAQELRQPMSSILGYTDFLLGESVGILGALQRKFLERVRVATERMDRLVDNLIQMTTLESNQFQLASQSVDLNSIIDEAISATSSQLREKNIALRVDLPDRLPNLNADRDALQQVVVNLLKNAGSASPSGSDILLHAHIESSEGERDYVLLQVTDSGEGIDPDDVPRVFSRLYRSENIHIPGVGDIGVGMSIVKTLVEALGGRIWVDSEPGKGSTFSVLLPVSQDNASSNGRRRTIV